jgi:hypothetical protein
MFKINAKEYKIQGKRNRNLNEYINTKRKKEVKQVSKKRTKKC